MISKLYSFLAHVIAMGVPVTLNKHDLFGLYSISFNFFIPLIHLANILKIIISVFPFFSLVIKLQMLENADRHILVV